jgi:dTDP-4-amino-4,6-dideoxygalactose transaminase
VAPILAQNAVPVFADVDPSDGNLDPAAVAKLIAPRTRAIMAAHLFGAPARVDELRALADEHGLALIEDCAQAWLTELPGGRLAGTVGDVGTLSLQQWKHITCGDGGLALTDHDEPEEPLNRAPLWGRPIYGSSRYPLHGYVPNPCPEAERLVAETLLIIDWNENYTTEHADAVAREITRFATKDKR